MSAVSAETSVDARRAFALRGNSFGAVVMILIQYGLGIWVNLYATLPQSDKGANVVTGVVRAITNGPLGLTLHAILGLLLVLTGTVAVVRAARLGRPLVTATAGVGLIAILVAGFFGAIFVGNGRNGASFIMALATAVAIFCYGFILMVTGFGSAGQDDV